MASRLDLGIEKQEQSRVGHSKRERSWEIKGGVVVVVVMLDTHRESIAKKVGL